jgi:aryl-alcohol dehydrogenase-like predicted oxidoreductase
MKYRLLGNSGLRVSEASLGTMTFGEDWGWGTGKDEARKVYNAFREAGGNFIDTANLYTNGSSESFLGEFMQGHRQSVVLATKYTNAAPGTDPNAAGNQRKNMMQSVEASLKRLQTDYIDLYWVHIWDQLTPVEEVMRGLDDLVSAGKVLYVGISDAPAWWLRHPQLLRDRISEKGRRLGPGIRVSGTEFRVCSRRSRCYPYRPCAGGAMTGRLTHIQRGDATTGLVPVGAMTERLTHIQRGGRHHRPCAGGAMTERLTHIQRGDATTGLVPVGI